MHVPTCDTQEYAHSGLTMCNADDDCVLCAALGSNRGGGIVTRCSVEGESLGDTAGALRHRPFRSCECLQASVGWSGPSAKYLRSERTSCAKAGFSSGPGVGMTNSVLPRGVDGKRVRSSTKTVPRQSFWTLRRRPPVLRTRGVSVHYVAWVRMQVAGFGLPRRSPSRLLRIWAEALGEPTRLFRGQLRRTSVQPT